MDNPPENKDKEDTEANVKPNFDNILIKEIGQFGNFQLRVLLLAGLVSIFAAWANNEFVFTTSRINSRCRIPECDSAQPEWTPYWLANAIPTSGSAFDNCQRFSNRSTQLRLVESETCPSTLFDRDSLVTCDEYVYENTYSVVYDFDLACDEWRRSLIGTIRTFGALLAFPITGYVSDRWGRSVAISVNSFNTAWLGVVRYWSNTYIGFMMSEFIEAIFGGGSFSSSYILTTELMGPKYRVAAGAAMNTFFAIGQITMSLIAWAVPDWRILTLTLYVPQFLTLLFVWLMFESARWYMSKGRYNDADRLLQKIAKINGKQLSKESLQALREAAELEVRNKTIQEQHNGKEPWLIVEVFRYKRILLRCIITPICWVSNTFIYHGLSISVVNISGNRYVNYLAVAAVEIPAYWIAVFLIGKIGRKPVLIGGYWLCSACQIAYIFMPDDLFAVSLTVYLIAKFAIALVVTAMYVYTAEMFPTSHRHRLFAFSSMIGRIGSMLAPLTPAIGAQWFEELPFALFAFFSFLSSLLIFLTPETLGIRLPDTFEEASQIGVKKKNVNK